MTTIVVGYDGAPPAERALQRAIAEAKGRNASLIVVAVAEMPLDPEGPQNFGSLGDSPAVMLPTVPPPEDQRLLDAARSRVEAEGVEGEYVWAVGSPATRIVGIAREREASLVVLGSHHHSWLGRVFGTDVSAAVEREWGAETLVVE
jgi:nucleotide-binding universal stress UspA family protein